ncbi:MAG: hypothetical protein LBU30_03520 [Candidatus Methanoplasma sp.]|nr:hypothetical protein [Candidatus Methanoplasma sp.]
MILDMLDGMGKEGREQLRKELEIERHELVELTAQLERTAKGDDNNTEPLNNLELICRDIYWDETGEKYPREYEKKK